MIIVYSDDWLDIPNLSMILDGKKWELTKNHPINGVFEKKKNETIGFIPKIWGRPVNVPFTHFCDSGVHPSAIQQMVMRHAYDFPDEMNIRNNLVQRVARLFGFWRH